MKNLKWLITIVMTDTEANLLLQGWTIT